jgi:hypothetical protein
VMQWSGNILVRVKTTLSQQVKSANKPQSQKRKKGKTRKSAGNLLTQQMQSTRPNCFHLQTRLAHMHALDTKDLLQGVSSTAKHHHYKVYEGDQICTTVDVGDIWCMRINGKDSCGITLKAKHMVILSRVGGQETEQVEEVHEEEVPGMDVFA